MRNTPRAYLRVTPPLRLPHNMDVSIALGHLPCRYVRILCLAGTPISFHSITVRGIPTKAIQRTLGGTLSTLISKTPERLLFGSSLEMSLGAVLRVPRHHPSPGRSTSRKRLANDRTEGVSEHGETIALPLKEI